MKVNILRGGISMIVIIMTGIVIWMSILLRSRLPPAKNLADATRHSDFSGQEATANMADFPTTDLQQSFNYIHKKLQDLQTLNGTNKLILETFPRDLSNMSIVDGTCRENEGYFNATQILVKLPGMFSSSILLSTRYGAQSNGASVLLEVLRNIVVSKGRPRNSLIIFFNSDSNRLLCGSKWLIDLDIISRYHIQAFIDLETSALTSSTLIQATDIKLAARFAHVAPQPYMNSLAGSFTKHYGIPPDFKTYQDANLPGVELVVSNDKVPQAELIQMSGSNVLAMTRALTNLDFLNRFHANDTTEFFDIAGYVGFPLSMDTRWLIVIVTNILALGVFLVYAARFHPNMSVSNVFTSTFRETRLAATAFLASWLGGTITVIPFSFLQSSNQKWLILSIVALGHLAGLSVVAQQWNINEGFKPTCISFARVSMIVSIFSSILSISVLFNWPGMYLLPIASTVYSSLVLIVYLILAVMPWLNDPSLNGTPTEMESLYSPMPSYSSIPSQRSFRSRGPRVNIPFPLIAFPAMFFLSTAFYCGVDAALALQSLNSEFAQCFIVPLMLTPSLHLLLPLFAYDSTPAYVYWIGCTLYLIALLYSMLFT